MPLLYQTSRTSTARGERDQVKIAETVELLADTVVGKGDIAPPCDDCRVHFEYSHGILVHFLRSWPPTRLDIEDIEWTLFGALVVL